MSAGFYEPRAGAAAEVACLVALVEVIMWVVPFTVDPRFAVLADLLPELPDE